MKGRCCLNNSWTDFPNWGGQWRSGETITIRIDFQQEYISFTRNGSDPVIILSGNDIGSSTFCLEGLTYYKEQGFEILQESSVSPLEDESSASLSILGLENDVEFHTTCARVQKQLRSPRLSFEKRLAL